MKEDLFAPWLEQDLLSFVKGIQQSQLALGQSGVKSSKYHDLSQLTPPGGWGYSLIWPLQGGAAGQGIVLASLSFMEPGNIIFLCESVLNRVGTCPKQGTVSMIAVVKYG